MRRLRRYIARQRRAYHQPDLCSTCLNINDVVHRFISQQGAKLGRIRYEVYADAFSISCSARIGSRFDPGPLAFVHQWNIMTYTCDNGCRRVRLRRLVHDGHVALILCRCMYMYIRRRDKKDFFLCLRGELRSLVVAPHKKH